MTKPSPRTFVFGSIFSILLTLTGCATLLIGGCGNSDGEGSFPSNILVSVESELLTLTDGQSVQFTASVSGDPNNLGVAWTAE